MLNSVQIIGRVGKEPELRSAGNTNIANLSIGVTKKWTKDGQKQEKTAWIPVTFFGKTVEVIQNYVKKGDLLYVEGEWDNSSYDKDGETRYVTKLVGNKLTMLGSGQKQETQYDEPAF